jgi:hypothetical protein
MEFHQNNTLENVFINPPEDHTFKLNKNIYKAWDLSHLIGTINCTKTDPNMCAVVGWKSQKEKKVTCGCHKSGVRIPLEQITQRYFLFTSLCMCVMKKGSAFLIRKGDTHTKKRGIWFGNRAVKKRRLVKVIFPSALSYCRQTLHAPI